MHASVSMLRRNNIRPIFEHRLEVQLTKLGELEESKLDDGAIIYHVQADGKHANWI
ncbi:MAG: hypothetical protein R3C11_20485 [Planctomycetaceae bacterium]